MIVQDAFEDKIRIEDTSYIISQVAGNFQIEIIRTMALIDSTIVLKNNNGFVVTCFYFS